MDSSISELLGKYSKNDLISLISTLSSKLPIIEEIHSWITENDIKSQHIDENNDVSKKSKKKDRPFDMSK